MSYDDNVLIKLRRDYSENEVIMYALNQLQEKTIEIGKLHSYIQELEDNPINLENLKEIEKLKIEVQKLKDKDRKRIEKINSNPFVARYDLLQRQFKELNALFKTVKNKNKQMNTKLYTILSNPANFNKKTLEEKMHYLSQFDLSEIEKE